MTARPTPAVAGEVCQAELSYGDAPDQVLDAFRPAAAVSGTPAVVLDGGSWRASVDRYDDYDWGP